MYVFANADCVVALGDARYRVTPGIAWEADHPLVRARPDLFSDEPLHAVRSPGSEAPIETATRRPGERRGTRRG